jgi:glycosyltransferase involved in cell wall biosynthesis
MAARHVSTDLAVLDARPFLQMASTTENIIAADSAVRPWRVLHACETTDSVVPISEAQSGVGMQPRILAREYWNQTHASSSISLLTAWNDIRDWRYALNDAEALTSFQIVHAHSFASAMAGVRGSLPLVYDFASTLEETAKQSPHASAGPWLLRSLRVAEQFALSRAATVVAHSQAMQATAQERGAAPENTFLVRDPISSAETAYDREWALKRGINAGQDLLVFILEDPEGFKFALHTFALIARELESAILLLEASNPDRRALMKLAGELGVADSIRWIDREEREQAFATCDIVIAPAPGVGSNTNRGMLLAMANSRPVIAADVSANRECSREGRGCLWFEPDDFEDSAKRATFVLQELEFGRALGQAGKSLIQATRSPEVIGRKYDEIYRHALARRSGNLPRISVPQIYAFGVQR